MMPSYPEWRARYAAWAERYPTYQQAALEMSALVAKRGVEASPFTLRYHLEGRFSDAKLTMAAAVSNVLDEIEAEEEMWG